MATIGIELTDAAVIAVRDGVRVAASPGIALAEPQGLLVGEHAAAAARLKPMLATDHFWTDLSMESFAPNAHPPLSHADLAHAHLAAIWGTAANAGDDAVFAVPGTMRLHHLGLLLGIARRIGISVAGIVDAAVAACADLAAQATVLHLDVQLHQAVLTEMQGADQLRRRRVEVAPRAGLKSMHAAWAQLVSEAMVRRTRFDPLHQAATEQQLYERLPDWLSALAAQDTVDASIEAGGSTFTVTVRREQFALAVEAWYAQLAELVESALRAGETATLVLSARAALLPSLRERFAALPELELVVLPDVAVAAAAASRSGEIGPADPPALAIALARKHALAVVAARPRRATGTPPTHLVHDGRAYAIDERPLVLGTGADAPRHVALAGQTAGISRSHCTLAREAGAVVMRDHSRYGSFVNGVRAEGETVLAAGDRLRLGTPGIVLELVAVS
jgi:hypothetical protein